MSFRKKKVQQKRGPGQLFCYIVVLPLQYVRAAGCLGIKRLWIAHLRLLRRYLACQVSQAEYHLRMDSEQAQAQGNDSHGPTRVTTTSPVGNSQPQSNHAPDPDEDDLDDLDGASRRGIADAQTADR